MKEGKAANCEGDEKRERENHRSENRTRELKLQTDEIRTRSASIYSTEVDNKVGPRLRELVPCGQRKLGGGIHAT